MIVYHVTAEKLIQVYYSQGNQGESRTIQWFTESDDIKIFLNVGSAVYYYTSPLETLPISISEGLLNRKDRILGLYKEEEEKVEQLEEELVSVEVEDDGLTHQG